jgi:low temperature requirement protein LtrA
MAAMLVVALTVPEAFDANAVLFGVAYLTVRLLRLLLYAIAGKHDPDLLGAVVRFAPWATLAPLLILAAGFFDGGVQGALWVIALAVDYLGAAVERSHAAPEVV